jgi:hypothetical protein
MGVSRLAHFVGSQLKADDSGSKLNRKRNSKPVNLMNEEMAKILNAEIKKNDDLYHKTE